MTRSHLYPFPEFTQFSKHSQHVSKYSLSLPELSLKYANFCGKYPHELNSISNNLAGEDIVSRFLSADAIYEVSQYNFDMEKITVDPKHAKQPNNDKKIKGIIVLDSILNPFKVIIYPILDIRYIGLVASGQLKSKIRKSYLKENLNFSKKLASPQE